MSFTSAQAEQLRHRLPVMDFLAAVAQDELIAAYLSHYGLDRLAAPGPFRHSLGTIDSGRYRLAGQYFEVPERARRGQCVIVHGYYDHVGLFRHPIAFCLARGYSVLCFDLPGHGLSDGDPAAIGSFDDYSQAVVDCLAAAGQAGIKGPWQVLAQSTGAAAMLNCLLRPAQFPLPELQNIFLLAPLLRPVDWGSGLLKYWLLRWFVNQVDRDFADNSHDHIFLQFIAADDPFQARHLKVDWVRSLRHFLKQFARAPRSEVPLTIIQGTDDSTVDWRYNLPRLQEKFPATRVSLIDGARHHLVNESELYREQLFRILGAILDH